jgi:hypothetical protein
MNTYILDLFCPRVLRFLTLFLAVYPHHSTMLQQQNIFLKGRQMSMLEF